jgi:hypothetical protein
LASVAIISDVEAAFATATASASFFSCIANASLAASAAPI